MCAASFLSGAYFSWGCRLLLALSVVCTEASNFSSVVVSLSAENGLEKDEFDR